MGICPYMTREINRSSNKNYIGEINCYEENCQFWHSLAENCGAQDNLISKNINVITTNPNNLVSIDLENYILTIPTDEDMINVKNALYAEDGSNQGYIFYDNDDNEITEETQNLTEDDYLIVTAEDKITTKKYSITFE